MCKGDGIAGDSIPEDIPELERHLAPAQAALLITFCIVAVLWIRAELLHTRVEHAGTITQSKRDEHFGDAKREVQLTNCFPRDSEEGAPISLPSTGVKLFVTEAMKLSPIRCMIGDRQALLGSRITLRSWTELGLILSIFFLADRSGLVPDADKNYDRNFFVGCCLLILAYGLCTSLARVTMPTVLNREQTEEWKGWMQILFLQMSKRASRSSLHAQASMSADGQPRSSRKLRAVWEMMKAGVNSSILGFDVAGGSADTLSIKASQSTAFGSLGAGRARTTAMAREALAVAF